MRHQPYNLYIPNTMAHQILHNKFYFKPNIHLFYNFYMKILSLLSQTYNEICTHSNRMCCNRLTIPYKNLMVYYLNTKSSQRNTECINTLSLSTFSIFHSRLHMMHIHLTIFCNLSEYFCIMDP